MKCCCCCCFFSCAVGESDASGFVLQRRNLDPFILYEAIATTLSLSLVALAKVSCLLLQSISRLCSLELLMDGLEEREQLRQSLNRMGKTLLPLPTYGCALKTIWAQSRNLEKKLNGETERERMNETKERTLMIVLMKQIATTATQLRQCSFLQHQKTNDFDASELGRVSQSEVH